MHPPRGRNRQNAMTEGEERDKKTRDWSRVNRSPHAVVRVWMKPEQRGYVERQAEAGGVSMSEYMKAAAMGVAPLKSRPRVDVDRKMLAQLLAEVGKIGSNLNQLARAANQQQLMTLEDYRNLKEMRQALAEIRDALMEALGREP